MVLLEIGSPTCMDRRAAWSFLSSARPKKSRATARTAGSSSQPCTERPGWKWRSARAAEPAPKPRTARKERRERGEGVEVGGGERAAAGAVGEREGVDVAGVVEEEEAGAGQRVARGARGHVGDADVVVRGADVGDELENMCPVCPRHRVNTGQHVPCQMKTTKIRVRC